MITSAFIPQAYGAAGDGERLETKAIQAAINAAAAVGGGTVHFPAGRYLTGTVHLRSNVALHIGQGAVILGSQCKDDYEKHPPVTPNWAMTIRAGLRACTSTAHCSSETPVLRASPCWRGRSR